MTEQDSCSFYFDESSILLDVNSDFSSYGLGDPILINGQITNETNYLLENLSVKAKLVKNIGEGEIVILEEFNVLENTILNAKSSSQISYNYLIPTNYSSGDYSVLFFVTNDSSDILGDSVYNTFVNYIDFSLEDGGDGVGVLLDNEDVDLSEMTFPVTNYSDSQKQVEITYSLYKNNFASPKNLVDEKQEKINLNSGETKTLNYEMNKAGDLLVIKTKVTSNLNESVYKAQTINYFQVSKEGSTKISLNTFDLIDSKYLTCFENSGLTGGSFEGTVEVSVIDSLGEEIYTDSKQVSLLGLDNGFLSEIPKNKIRKDVTLSVKLFDSNGNLVDENYKDYSCDQIGGYCSDSGSFPFYPIVIALAVLMIIIIIGVFIKRKLNIELV